MLVLSLLFMGSKMIAFGWYTYATNYIAYSCSFWWKITLLGQYKWYHHSCQLKLPCNEGPYLLPCSNSCRVVPLGSCPPGLSLHLLLPLCCCELISDPSCFNVAVDFGRCLRMRSAVSPENDSSCLLLMALTSVGGGGEETLMVILC